MGRKITSPYTLLNENKEEIIIVIASMYSEEISSQLSRMGFVNNVDYLIASIPKKVEPSMFLAKSNYKIQRGTDKGKIIFDKKHKKIYRGYFHEDSEIIKEKIKKCTDLKLLGNDIVSTQISDLKVYPFDLLVEHELIEPFTDSSDWSPVMIYDAFLKTLNIMESLNKKGLTLHDPNTKNITYYKNNFIWSDFGSISSKEQGLTGVRKLVNDGDSEELSFLQKIILIHRKKLTPNETFKYPSPAYGYLDGSSKKRYEKLIDTLNELFLRKNNYKESIKQALAFIKSFIAEYKVRVDQDLYSYYRKVMECNWFYLIESLIIKFMEKKELKTVSLIDLGDKYEKKMISLFPILKQNNIDVITIQDDDDVNDVIYQLSKDMNLTCYPIVTKKYNTWIHSPYNYHDFEVRVTNKLLVAFNFVHELVFYRQRTFKDVVKILEGLTFKYLIVEFLTEDNSTVKKLRNETYLWYTLTEFIKEIEKKFTIIEAVKFEDSRRIFICELDDL